jgi:hypothetical protein
MILCGVHECYWEVCRGEVKSEELEGEKDCLEWGSARQAESQGLKEYTEKIYAIVHHLVARMVGRPH